MSKKIVGIDLGTTHSALCHVDALAETPSLEVLGIPQWVASQSYDALPLLPSFIYIPHESEPPYPLPWDEKPSVLVGEWARARAQESPLRMITSAKSWLSHPHLDAQKPCLPVHAAEEVQKYSPVEASSFYLKHLREAYRKSHSEDQVQELVLTVPASFDAAARENTVEAARLAGFEQVRLLEEPQAALYAWIHALGTRWRNELKLGDVILVIDIGGGTTDFSTVHVREQEGDLILERLAVGDHILLGGDNMDLALAQFLKQKLENTQASLDRSQMLSLIQAARANKEFLLNHPEVLSAPIRLTQRGSKLIGNTLKTELLQSELETLLLDGFFPEVQIHEKPMQRVRSGLQQLGLNYAADPAITKHLAAFLSQSAEGFQKPSCVLFNGGVCKSKAFRERILHVIRHWVGGEVRELPAADFDLAVAKGAAFYGLARQGKALRIRGGTARSYYIGIESNEPSIPGMDPEQLALCVAPFGMEEGAPALSLPMPLGALVGHPVRFRFFSSTIRRQDTLGVLLEHWTENELEEIRPIEMILRSESRHVGELVPVRLQIQVTEVGVLQMDAYPVEEKFPGESWRVELNVRDET